MGIAAALCLLIIVVRVQQYVFQFRAERLENDMKSLKYGSTTLAQAQPIFRRWNATYDDGPCESAKCSGEITIGDFAYAHAEFFSRHQRLFRAYGVLGGRPAFLRAGASILDGVVRSKSYSLDVEVFRGFSERGRRVHPARLQPGRRNEDNGEPAGTIRR